MKNPSINEINQLEWPESLALNTTGTHLVVIVTSPDVAQNRYEKSCRIIHIESGKSFDLNRPGTSIDKVEWVNEDTLLVRKTIHSDNEDEGGGEKAQIWLHEGLMGEGRPITAEENGVSLFKPFADGMVYVTQDKEAEMEKKRTGKVVHFEQEASTQILKYLTFEQFKSHAQALRLGIDEKELDPPVVNVSEILSLTDHIDDIHRTAQQLFLNCRNRADLVHRVRNHRMLTVNDGSWQMETLRLPDPARIVLVAEDRLVVLAGQRDDKIYTQGDLMEISLTQLQSGAAYADIAKNLTAGIDREIYFQCWYRDGVIVNTPNGTRSSTTYLSRTDGAVKLDTGTVSPSYLDARADVVAYIGLSASSLPEVFVIQASTPVKLTDFHAQVEHLQLGEVETISWQSVDGETIEGVLRKPADFDPKKQYPLVFIVHGGPTAFSPETLIGMDDKLYYPGIQFSQQGILTLKPNYRGSTGRGQAFMELNVDNLGVGDLWDIESAIDHLDALGMIDTDRVGCMGWSQGGYVSAFAGNHSRRFKAVSVGAGISDWYTYHITNDVPFFTTDYLSGSPFDDRTAYTKTAPISGLSEHSAPHLIQHGEIDQRVPLANALELYRGLQSKSVDVELFIFPGMAHPVTKPRENRLIMAQNLSWFCHYLLGMPLDLRAADAHQKEKEKDQ